MATPAGLITRVRATPTSASWMGCSPPWRAAAMPPCSPPASAPSPRWSPSPAGRSGALRREPLRLHRAAVRAGVRQVRPANGLGGLHPAGRTGADPSPKPAMVWLESPTNPLLKVIDLEAVCAIATTPRHPCGGGQHLRHRPGPAPAGAGRHPVTHQHHEIHQWPPDALGGAYAPTIPSGTRRWCSPRKPWVFSHRRLIAG